MYFYRRSNFENLFNITLRDNRSCKGVFLRRLDLVQLKSG